MAAATPNAPTEVRPLVQRFLARRGLLLREVVRFGIVGAVDTGLHFGLFNLLFAIGWNPLVANGLALAVAVASSYVFNRYWTFSHRARSGVGRELSIFLVLNGIGWLISQAALWVARYPLDITDQLLLNLALVVGTGAGTLFRFLTYKRFVFLSPERAAARLERARRQHRAPAPEPAKAQDPQQSLLDLPAPATPDD